MDCPKCKLLNLSSAERCDCGYDFKTDTMQEAYLSERDKRLWKPKIVRAISTRNWLLVFCAVQLLGWLLCLRTLRGGEEVIIFDVPRVLLQLGTESFPWTAGNLLLFPGLTVSFLIHGHSSPFFRFWFTTACNGVVWGLIFAAVWRRRNSVR